MAHTELEYDESGDRRTRLFWCTLACPSETSIRNSKERASSFMAEVSGMTSRERALADAQTIAELEQFPWPEPDQFDYAALAEQCARHILKHESGAAGQTRRAQNISSINGYPACFAK